MSCNPLGFSPDPEFLTEQRHYPFLCIPFLWSMETQEQIIARLKELLDLPVQETMRESAELKSGFYVLNHQRLEKQKMEHRELGAKMEDFIPIPNPLEEKFKVLFSVYRDNKAKFQHQKQEVEKKNLEEKTTILKELKELIDNEENIGKSFHRFKDFQDRWKDSGAVPKENAAGLNTDYKAEIDRFYYNITINKELKEYDLAKNLEIRNAIVAKLEELQTEKKIKDIELILVAAKEEWEEAGPVKPDDFGDLRDRYYSAVRTLHKKIQDFYSERKEKMEVNLETKKQMVARVLELTEGEYPTIGKWNKVTDEVLKLRDDWKKVGVVERKQNNKVWDEFKAAQDAFFGKKKEFFGEARESFKEHKEQKEKLIERAEKSKDSTEWKKTTEDLIRLQNDWKKVGSAGQRDENKLWKKFRGVCDAFFTAKKEWFDGMDDRHAANLKAKEALLEKMGKTKLKGSDEEGLAGIKALTTEWAAIEHVPKKDMKRISSDYEKAIDTLYAQLKMDKRAVAKIRFRNKVERMAEGKEGADLLEKEEFHLKKKLKEKQSELMKYENNMAFFANAKPDNPLLITANKNIETMQMEVDGLNDKLRLLKTSIRKVGAVQDIS